MNVAGGCEVVGGREDGCRCNRKSATFKEPFQGSFSSDLDVSRLAFKGGPERTIRTENGGRTYRGTGGALAKNTEGKARKMQNGLEQESSITCLGHRGWGLIAIDYLGH